ncbi:nuclear transport factor 2 family protein [Aureisphaera galaxeae]|uniref:nuclear transport factor 2 family protein n=1 Tax=Aureisphaera galaxeae TaxID=1538023 RepID=UPI00234FFD23|nr:nuclear transport factor 2 family protein [Aureisphaera galaxeae]MDC8003724.1 nuclear transport factor 2 family protein [Aureisphaera galaxeae]
MKHLLPLLIIIILSSCKEKKPEVIVASEETTTQIETEWDMETEMEKLRFLKEVEWPKAYREQDTVLLDRILGNDFQMVRNDGEWSNKEKELEWIKNNAMNHDFFRYEIKRLEVFENGTAIIAGTGHMVNGGDKTDYESSNVLIYRDGIWKAVLSHVSGVRNVD